MPDTYNRLLNLATSRFMASGFNAVSFSDLSAEIGVSKAAIHYHFASKEDLALTAIETYAENTLQKLERYERESAFAYSRLTAYVQSDEEMIRNGQLCLCGMFHSELTSIPESVRLAAIELRTNVCQWLCKSFDCGRNDGSISFQGQPSDHGALFFSALEGAVLISRPNCNLHLFRNITQRLLKNYLPREAPQAVQPPSAMIA